MKILRRIQNLFIEPHGPNLSLMIEENGKLLKTYLYPNDVADLLNTLIIFWAEKIEMKKPCVACLNYETKICDTCNQKDKFLSPIIKSDLI